MSWKNTDPRDNNFRGEVVVFDTTLRVALTASVDGKHAYSVLLPEHPREEFRVISESDDWPSRLVWVRIPD